MRPIWSAARGSSSSRTPRWRSSPSQELSGPQLISSGSQTSARPPAKPKVVKPIVSRARLPANTIRSAQEILRPYFSFTGQSSRRALSRLRLSGQLFSGAKRCIPALGPPRPSCDAVRPGAVPHHPDHQWPVVAEVGRPPLLRGRQHVVDVLGQSVEVEGCELRGVVEVLAHGVGRGRVFPEGLQVELVRPPVAVGSGSRPGNAARGRRREAEAARAPLFHLAVHGVRAVGHGHPPRSGELRCPAHGARPARSAAKPAPSRSPGRP